LFAQPLTGIVGDEEQHDGIQVIFPVNGRHAISGSVVAKSDNHPVNMGSIELQDPDTKTAMRTATIGEDGSFHLNYIPEGSYLLKVTATADTEPGNGTEAGGSDLGRLLNSKPVRTYGPASMPLLLTSDATGLLVQVPDAAARPAKNPE
jgi:hypothetical protein